MKTNRRINALFLAVCLLAALAMGSCGPAKDERRFTASAIDKYGNLKLDALTEELLDYYDYGDIVTVFLNGKAFTMPVVSSYSDVDDGQLLLRLEKESNVKIAVNGGYFCPSAGVTGEELPLEVTVKLTKKEGYLDEWLMRSLSWTKERSDYPHLNDAEFANFRQVVAPKIGKNALYRTSSPVNPENKRNECADNALREAGVKAILNLADTEEVMRQYEGYADTYYAGQKVIAVGLPIDFNSEAFGKGLGEGLRFLAEQDGPYAIHCKEGKDRAGFATALLMCLAGATAEEVIEDYMVTYYNYYGVEKSESRYDKLAEGNIVSILCGAFSVTKGDFRSEKTDLAALAREYLQKKAGMSGEEIDLLLERLGKNYA